ncbi:SDR family oxidoreductase [Salegentibacter sp. F188]|uniref:SDR family oxidoreductase n=1 Tax=Autumnicola patrickiae TaxID=3075591 RepID=A0ABU3DZB9_9FLAO|nr:SDR family oxidoreductase [Salegentibacter sp. F188]MDT0689005.1 SDR family oxidoreductase [Salegentibacter sp. F188]
MRTGILSRKALITGGSNGIGCAIAKKFSSENFRTVIADIKNTETDEENIFFCRADVSRSSDIDHLFKYTTETIGDPDVLVINAGRGIQELLTEGDPEKWQEVININVMGALRIIRAFVPAMLEKKQGNVVFISSVSANQPHPSGGIYSASKTALEVIAETLRLETLPHINVTVISPGITNTKFFENQISGHTSVEGLDMGFISPEDLAEDVFYAISRKNNRSINKIITRPLKQIF